MYSGSASILVAYKDKLKLPRVEVIQCVENLQIHKNIRALVLPLSFKMYSSDEPVNVMTVCFLRI